MKFLSNALLALLFVPVVAEAPIEPQLVDEQLVKDYFAGVPEQKRHEHWQQIVDKGEKALEACLQLNLYDEEMRIRQQMASAYYFMGQFTQALAMAQKSYDIAMNLDNSRGKIKSLTLTSSALRGTASVEREERTKKSLYKAAKVYAINALVNCEGRQKEEEVLRAKALYSLGAIEQEDFQEGNPQTAKTALKAALQTYKKYTMADDCQRTIIRLAKIKLQEGKIDKAYRLIEQITPQIVLERTRLKAEFLGAQIALAMGNRDNAAMIATRAKEMAQKLQAKADEANLDRIISHIENP